MKVWERAGIKLATPGSVVRRASVARHITECAMWSGLFALMLYIPVNNVSVISGHALAFLG